MLITIEPTEARPIYLQIMDEIRRAIALALIRPDEPLPSVRQLATELRINPNTVQQAYRELERDGTVYVKRGRGTFVARRESADEERKSLARAVAERALREAFRQGVSVEELSEALREVAKRNESGTDEPGSE